MQNPRKIVFDALLKFFRDEAYSNLLIDYILNNNELSALDKGFASRLFYGVIERKITLDFYISKLSKKPVKKLSPSVLNALRMALYQIEYMDKIPQSAAINEAVKLIKASSDAYASGFVNAVLREFCRNKPLLPTDNSAYALSVRYSCNSEIIMELSDYIGKSETDSFLSDSLLPPPTYIRVNTNKISAKDLIRTLQNENIKAAECDIPNALKLEFSGSIINTNAYNNGYFFVEDIASQIAVSALSPSEKDSLLDVCAAPGGKSFSAAIHMNNSGKVVSCDIHPHRVELIKTMSQHLGLTSIDASVNDATVYNPQLGKYSKIICDVPCSGVGVIRRKPEIKYKKPDDLTTLPDLQYNILSTSSEYLLSGGCIMYSTCTLRKAENEDVVAKFLETHPNFSADTVSGFDSPYVRLYPSKYGSDGFFFTILRKREL